MKKLLPKIFKDAKARETVVDISEALVDSVFKDGIMKDIPIIGTIAGVPKIIHNVKDKLFIEKLKSFVYELRQIDPQKIIDEIENIDHSNEYRIKVGVKLGYIIDEAKDHEVAQYIGKWFVAFLLKKISYSQFLRGVKILQDIFLKDFEKFISQNEKDIVSVTDKKGARKVSEFQYNLINVGLCMLDLKEISDFEKRQNIRMTEGALREGAGVSNSNNIGTRTLNDLLITEIGYLLKDYFQLKKE